MHSEIKRKFSLRIFLGDTAKNWNERGKDAKMKQRMTRENAEGKSNVEPKLKV